LGLGVKTGRVIKKKPTTKSRYYLDIEDIHSASDGYGSDDGKSSDVNTDFSDTFFKSDTGRSGASSPTIFKMDDLHGDEYV
jgi:hypothetical protein